MAITKIGDTEIYDGTDSDVVVNKPTGVQEDDVLIMFMCVDDESDPDYNTPSGWTLLAKQSVTSGGDHECYGWYKVAGASEPSSYTITPVSANSEQKLVMLRAYRGVDTSTPIDDWGVQQETAGPTLYTPSVDVANNGSKLICGWMTASYSLITYYVSLSATLENITLSSDSSLYRGMITADEDEDSGSAVIRQWNGESAPSEDVSTWSIVLKPVAAGGGDIDEIISIDFDSVDEVMGVAKANIDEVMGVSAS